MDNVSADMARDKAREGRGREGESIRGFFDLDRGMGMEREFEETTEEVRHATELLRRSDGEKTSSKEARGEVIMEGDATAEAFARV